MAGVFSLALEILTSSRQGFCLSHLSPQYLGQCLTPSRPPQASCNKSDPLLSPAKVPFTVLSSLHQIWSVCNIPGERHRSYSHLIDGKTEAERSDVTHLRSQTSDEKEAGFKHQQRITGSQSILQCLLVKSFCLSQRGAATGIQWVEPGSATKGPTMHRTAPHHTEWSTLKCQYRWSWETPSWYQNAHLLNTRHFTFHYKYTFNTYAHWAMGLMCHYFFLLHIEINTKLFKKTFGVKPKIISHTSCNLGKPYFRPTSLLP